MIIGEVRRQYYNICNRNLVWVRGGEVIQSQLSTALKTPRKVTIPPKVVSSTRN